MSAQQRQGISYRPVDRDLYEREQRRSLTRAIYALALRDVGSRKDPGDILRRTWPNDTAADLILRAAVSPTSTSSYPTFTTAVTLPALAPQSAAVRLFANALKVDLTGVASITVPYAATQPQVGFVAEGSPAPLPQFSLAGVTVGPARKLLVLSAVTGELENSTPETASAVIGRMLADATAKALDSAVFSNVAADSTRPGGLLNGVSAITATAGGGLAALVGDLGNLAGEIADGGINADDMIIVTHPETATKLRLLASPAFTNTILGTPQVAVGTVIAVAPGGLAVGYSGAPDIESSFEATVHFEDTTPLAISTPGSPNTVAAPVRSAFQHNLIVIRVRCRCAWGALPDAIQYLTGATW